MPLNFDPNKRALVSLFFSLRVCVCVCVSESVKVFVCVSACACRLDHSALSAVSAASTASYYRIPSPASAAPFLAQSKLLTLL